MDKNAKASLLLVMVIAGCSDSEISKSGDHHQSEANRANPIYQALEDSHEITDNQVSRQISAGADTADGPAFPKALLDPSLQHDINPALFDHFWDKWQLVTTRWREDNKELRFTYANPLAWETMKSGKGEYPEGAVLTKMGVQVMEDPLFPNSQIPSRRVNRVQVMLKDPSNPKAAKDGWVYSLYVPMKPDGVMRDKDIKACASCHEKAKSRGGVFSLPMMEGHDFEKSSVATLDGHSFKKTTVKEIPELLKLSLSKSSRDSDTAYIHQLPLFNGSINEYIPVIAKRVVDTQVVQAVYDEYDQLYLVGFPDQSNKECVNVITSRMSGIDSSSGGTRFSRENSRFCKGNLVERKEIEKPVIPAVPGQPYPNQSQNLVR